MKASLCPSNEYVLFGNARATYVPAAGALKVAVPLVCPFVNTYPARYVVFGAPTGASAIQSSAFPGNPAYVTVIVEPAA